jgi:hypothetical protein
MKDPTSMHTTKSTHCEVPHPFDAPLPTGARELDSDEEIGLAESIVMRLADQGLAADQALSVCLAAALRVANWHDLHPEHEVTSRAAFDRVLARALESSRGVRIAAAQRIHGEAITAAQVNGLALVDLTTAPPTIEALSPEDTARRIAMPMPPSPRVVFRGEDFTRFECDGAGRPPAGPP